ncbi:MAG: hypothetical protein WA741_29350, partial [Candidatus Sulfotelmatobacter sp.]
WAYRQTRPTTHATPAQKLALNAIERAKPEITPQLVWPSALLSLSSESYSNHDSRDPMSSPLIDGVLHES